MTPLRIDIHGIDLVLAGGVWLLERVPGRGESTTILIRGTAGSGKTLFGTQLAASIARAIKSDVAYACVELLPVELQAQHEGLKRPKELEQVVILPNDKSTDSTSSSGSRIYAGLLDLELDVDRPSERLGEALEAFLKETDKAAGRQVRVIVIDSLSDGYGLGTKAPRVLADEVCKLAAARGLVLVLLEEKVEEVPSVWSFAVDTVFELAPAGLEPHGALVRRFTVSKNRLGPSDPGPHDLVIAPEWGATVWPRARAYRTYWAYEQIWNKIPDASFSQDWFPEEFKELEWLPPFRRCITLVGGTERDRLAVARIAYRIGQMDPRSDGRFGDEWRYTVGETGGPSGDALHGKIGMLVNGSAFLHHLREWLQNTQRSPSRVLIGDLSNLWQTSDPDGVKRSLLTVVPLLRDRGIPIILLETYPEHGSAAFTGIADVVVQIRQGQLSVESIGLQRRKIMEPSPWIYPESSE